MKIVLVLLNEFLAKSRGKKLSLVGRKGAYAPSTLTTLASLVPQELSAEIVLFDEFIESFDPHTIQADIVGLSFTTTNAFHAYNLAAILKKRGITVVFGGYHTTALPTEASMYADACVIGYAERSWPKLLLDFQRGDLKKIYQEPYDQDFLDLNTIRYDLLKKKKYFYPFTLEYSRSCNNSCKFCVIPSFSNGGLVCRPIQNVCRDIKEIGGKNIVFLDSSPTENIEGFTELCLALKPLKINWYTNGTFKVADNPELIKLMSESGCRGLLVGFESINQSSLDDQEKSFNKVDKYKDFIKLLHQHKIYVLASIVFGFDNDDPSVFKKTVKFVNDCNIDVVHYAILTPFPGSPLFESLKKQGRILTENWSLYDSLHITFRPKRMTPEELQKGFDWAYLKTHSLPSILKRNLCSPTGSIFTIMGNVALGIYGYNVIKANK